MAGPVEIKVSVATAASAVSALGMWALQAYVFKGDVPPPVAAAVQVLVPGACTFVAGWLAPHTRRPDLAVADAEPPAYLTQDEPGAHELDGDAGEIPVSQFHTPQATRFDGQDATIKDNRFDEPS